MGTAHLPPFYLSVYMLYFLTVTLMSFLLFCKMCKILEELATCCCIVGEGWGGSFTCVCVGANCLIHAHTHTSTTCALHKGTSPPPSAVFQVYKDTEALAARCGNLWDVKVEFRGANRPRARRLNAYVQRSLPSPAPEKGNLILARACFFFGKDATSCEKYRL